MKHCPYLLSPAKINLFLKVLFRREDGYHEIASLFRAVSLCDRIYYCLSDQDELTCSDSTLPCDHTNLVTRALMAFRRKTGLRFFLNLHLEKKIPMEAGLGGGSSNAATVLFLCNLLNGFPLSEGELRQLGAFLGSDISFFFSTGMAYCTGRGEIVEPVSDFQNTKRGWIVKPPMGLSTKLVFSHYRPHHSSSEHPRDILHSFTSGYLPCINDLEESAFTQLPELKRLKMNLIEQKYDSVVMTGSGTAFVCLGDQAPIVDSDISCYPIYFLDRKEGEWYQ